jgi:modulator of FtsH protease
MITADIYHPAQWHDFFVMVGTGVAALTGLVFVAMTLNINVVVGHAGHRARAISTLAGLTAVFVQSALVLMGGQDHVAVGAELLVVAAIACAVFVSGYFRSTRAHQAETATLGRMVGGSAFYLAELVGAAMLVAGLISGLYVATVAIVANVAFMISGAWLLLVAARGDERAI